MKLVMIAPFPPKPDGIGQHTSDLVDELNVIGDIDVHVLTTDPSAATDDEEQVHRRLRVGRGTIREPLDALRDIRPDVIHYQFAVPALGLTSLGAFVAGSRYRKESGAQIVITLHEVRREIHLLRGVGRALYRRLVSFTDALIVHTGEARNLTIEGCGADPRAVHMMPHGASPPAPDLITASKIDNVRERYGVVDRPFVLCLGFLHPDKGIEFLVDAVAEVCRRGRAPCFDVLIAGAVRPRTGVFRYFERADHEYEARLRTQVTALDLDERVRFLGFAPRSDVPALFASCRVVAMPCTDVTQSSVLATATVAGAPAIVSDLPGLREAIGDGGILVPPGDADELADALEAFMSDDDLAAHHREHQERRRDPNLLAGEADGLRRVYAAVSEAQAADKVRRVDIDG